MASNSRDEARETEHDEDSKLNSVLKQLIRDVEELQARRKQQT